jgi:predicted membrane channel-forming protein YqfA (hemolysin III family)
MKNIQILVLFIIGSVLTALGVIFKSMEYVFASFFLIFGMTFNGVALISMVFKLLKKKETDTFMDS